ncbi:MAG: hypothetical protein ABSG41_09660 [Bryobacteraceae bacterium]|jgi:hypothetical protein
MKVAQLGPPVYSLQPVETDGKAVIAQLGIENKSGTFAKSGSVYGDTCDETLVRVLTTQPFCYREPYRLL